MTIWRESYSSNFRLEDVELIIFDMDGLLLDTERISIEAWTKACKKYGYDLDIHLAIQRIGASRNTRDEFYEKYIGSDFPKEEVDQLRDQYFMEMINSRDTILKEGVTETLDYLDDLGLNKAVATSTYRSRATELLRLMNIYDRFDLVICGDDVVNPKPDPEIYEKVCRSLGISKNKAIVLEDSDIGSLAAYNAGIPYILVPDLKPPTEECINNAYGVLKSLSDFKNIFKKTR